MLLVNINGSKYKFLSKQSEISLALGQELEELRKEYPCDCNPKYQQICLTLLCGCSLEEAMLVTEEQLARLIGTHPYFRNDIYVQHQEIIRYKGKLYKYMNLFQPMSVEVYGNLDFLAINEQLDDLVLSLYQPIENNLRNRLKYRNIKNIISIEDMNYFQYKLSLYWYYKQKEELLRDYGLSIEDDGIPADQKPDPYILTDLERYGIYHIVMELCDNDYDKQEKWLKRDIRELFKYLKYVNKKIVIKNQQQQSTNI